MVDTNLMNESNNKIQYLHRKLMQEFLKFKLQDLKMNTNKCLCYKHAPDTISSSTECIKNMRLVKVKAWLNMNWRNKHGLENLFIYQHQN